MSVKSKSKKSRRSTSLTVLLALAFAVLSIVAMLLVGVFQTIRNYQAQQVVAIGQQRFIALDAANQVASFVEQIFNILESSAQVSRSFGGTAKEQEIIVENLMILQPALHEVALLNQQGQELVKQSRLVVLGAKDLSNRGESDLFRQISQGQRYISPVHIGQITTEPLVTVAVPVNDPFGDFAGALVAEVNLKFMWDLVASLEIGQSGRAYVVDEQGNLIAFEDISRILRGENLRHLDEVAEFLAGRAEGEQIDRDISVGINGDTVLVTHVPLGKPNWAVVAELPVTEAYQSVILELGVSILILLLIACLAAVAGVYLSRRLATPLLNLTQIADQIAQGNLDLEAPIAGATEVGQLASAFNSMTRQLRGSIGSLGLQIRRLGVAATLSERLSAILDLEMLLVEVVNQVQDSFNYYHTHIYLLDKRGELLVVAEGTGEAGRQMKDQGHSIPLNAPTSLVALAARNKELVQVDNVRENLAWLPNALLPDTQAEMAVPIVLDGNVMGVLDVQSNKIGGLDEGDASLLRSLANQVAVTIRNTNLFAEVEEALAEARATQIRYIEQTWEFQTPDKPEYNYHRADVTSLDKETLAQLKQAAVRQEQPAVIAGLNGHQKQAAIVAPIKLQNQVVGTMHFLEADPGRSHVWTDQEIAFVQAIADQVAQTAETLRLFEETRQQASYEQLAGEIAQKLRQAPTLDALAQVAAVELNNALKVSRSFVKVGMTPAQAEIGDDENGHNLSEDVSLNDNV